MPETPEWRKALRDISSIGTGVFLLFHEALAREPREIVMYVGAVLLVGPGVLRSLGK